MRHQTHRLPALLPVLLAAALLWPSPAPARVIDDFSYSSSEAAARSWKASAGSPTVFKDNRPGVVFSCVFGKGKERVYWDREVRLDLTAESSIRVDIECDNPAALRSPTLYFKSGDGWYICRLPLRGPGRRLIHLTRSDFSTEDKPAGWHKIERVRFSAWAGDGSGAKVRLYALDANADPVLLVRNTLSTDDPAEKRFAERVLQRISRWLSDMSVPHGIITDQEVIHGGLTHSRVAVLCYNPHPPPREIESLRLFIQNGGKVVVFYGADQALAGLMRVRLEKYKRSEIPGQWSSFVFTKPSFWSAPERIYQSSFNIMAAKPIDASGDVVAYWEDAGRKRTGDAAWIASRSGLWMTHVLLEDDAMHKREMLTGLIASLDPGIWVDVARGAVDRIGQIDSFTGFHDAWSRISAAADSSTDPGRVRKLLDKAGTEYRGMLAHYEDGHYRETYEKSRRVHELLLEAFGRVQTPREKEFRGVWDHEGTGWFPGDWDRTCRLLEESGINAVFPNMTWGGLAHYPSALLPESTTSRHFGDQMAACIKAAHGRGMEVHAWVVCWQLGNAPADFAAKLKKAGRLQVSASGKTTSWMCPSHPDNVALQLGVLREIIRTYPVDGIHLDYIRYPGAEYCYCPTCRKQFEQWLGQGIARWPDDARPKGRHGSNFQTWRAGRITSFVRAARDQSRALNSEVKLSAAVWGGYPMTVDTIGQDWGTWLKQGIVDFVCPMNYTADNARFAELLRNQMALPGAKGRIYPGLGVTADESQLTADKVVEQVLLLRRMGAPGFMLFDLSHTLRLDTLPTLSLGLTRPGK